MTCCRKEKKILKVLRGTKSLDIYIELEGLGDWDLLAPPSGHEYEVWVAISGPKSASMSATIANSNTIKFTLDAYQAENIFWELGSYSLVARILLWTIPHGEHPVAARLFEVDTCIHIYEEVSCPPVC